ncbi:MAG TPA: hypothetical protein VG603_07865 [Chitinophagales bacterium]|nr:hypothetical protein [Chitinophagales bacterium]
MKTAMLILTLVITTATSHFAPAEGDEKSKGNFYASIDGRSFQLQQDQDLKGILVKKNGSMDGRTPGKTVISTSFSGPSYDKKDGHTFNESIQFEIPYVNDQPADVEQFNVGMQFQSTDYSLIKDQSKLRITQITWEDDKKHFRLNAEFDCKMRSWGYPSDGKKDVNLKGRMSGIRVTVPSWLAAKN